MFKKTIAIALSLLFTLSQSTAFAINTNNIYSSIPPSEITAYLTSDAGEIIEVHGNLVNSKFYSISDDSLAVYEFNLYSTPSYSLSANQADGSLSVRSYLTINYKTKASPTEYLLTSVSGSWSILDSSVSVTGASLRYSCAGISPDYSPNNAYDQRITNGISVSNNFSKNTGYSKYILQQFGILSADLTLNLKMGTSRTWTFTMYNTLFS